MVDSGRQREQDCYLKLIFDVYLPTGRVMSIASLGAAFSAAKLRPAVLCSSIVAFGNTGAAIAQSELKPAPTDWKVSEEFKGGKARENLSGAACTTRAPPFTSCVIVNDQKKYAQLFSINGSVIRPGKVIRLLGDDQEGDPDAEGAAYDAGYFYITGSHGRSRRSDKKNDSSYVVFRFPVNSNTGEPTFDGDEVVGLQTSHRIRDVIKNKVPDFYDKPLMENGANIEGIAVKDGRIYFGLRGPSDKSNAFIISVDAKAAFTPDQDLQLPPQLPFTLQLGPDTGIRDLAAVANGLLVLTGPVNDQKVTPAIRHWDPNTRILGPARELQIPDDANGGKAETLLILKDVAGEPWRALVIFEKPENGAPTEYAIPR
jgi:Protein of unknown function (DUF3616)